MTSPDLSYPAVHWKDGMKLTEEHFVAHDNHLHDIVRDTAWSSLNDFNYGLLPAFPSAEPLQLRFSGDALEVKACKALTAGGIRIHVTSQQPPLRLALPAIPPGSYGTRETEYYVAIAVDPFKPTAMGEPDPQQTPLRFPYAAPRLGLELIPKTQAETNAAGNHWLAVSKVHREGDGWQPDPQYIPPCTRVNAHGGLRKFHGDQGDQLEKIIEKATLVFKNAHRAQADKDPRLSEAVSGLAGSLLNALALSYDAYQVQLPQQEPVHLVLFFKRLARTLAFYVKGLQDADREHMFNYIRTHTGKEYAFYLQTIEGVSKAAYTHLDVRPSLQSTEQFVQMLLTLFDKLVDLSYLVASPVKQEKPWKKL
jgi:predicted component of type VI protein secretion system